MKRKLKMRRALSFLMAGIMLFSVLCIAPSASNNSVFTDIDGHWAEKDIIWAYENYITNGVTDSLFGPENRLTRAMFVTFLSRTVNKAGEDVSSASDENPFFDIAPGAWYYDAAVWAFEAGIVEGISTRDGKAEFAAEKEITRQETATMLYRLLTRTLQCQINTENAQEFPDMDQIASWAQPAALTLSAVRVFKGADGGKFMPEAVTNRAATATLCHRVYTLLRPEEVYAPQIRCVGFSPVTFDLDSVEDIPFTTGRVRFGGTLTEDAKILLSTPEIEEEDLKLIDAADYYTIDGNAHTYDIVWLPNNAVLFYCDGEQVNVLGRDRTYSEEMSDEVFATGKEYQDPTVSPMPTTITFKNFEARNQTLYRLIDESPLGLHGALRVNGSYLVDDLGEEVVLRGMHLFVYTDEDQLFTRYEELKWLRDDWGINCIRLGLIPLYYNEYWNDTQRKTAYDNMNRFIQNCEELGIYVLLDWHGYEEYPMEGQDEYVKADPRIYEDDAAEFFSYFSEKYADCDHIIYELYNEPTGGKKYPQFSYKEITRKGIKYLEGYEYTWNEVLVPYSEKMIDIIRANDPNAIVVVNTPEADQHPEIAAVYPMDYENLMYSMHPFAGGGSEQVYITRHDISLRNNICIFDTETGFYPDEEGSFINLGLPNTVENAIWRLHGHHEQYLANYVEKYKANYIYFLLLRSSDSDYRASFRAAELPIDQRSAWADDQLTFTGEYMRHWFRKMAGLEDNTWFEEWHVENDEYYDALIEEQLGGNS